MTDGTCMNFDKHLTRVVKGSFYHSRIIAKLELRLPGCYPVTGWITAIPSIQSWPVLHRKCQSESMSECSRDISKIFQLVAVWVMFLTPDRLKNKKYKNIRIKETPTELKNFPPRIILSCLQDWKFKNEYKIFYSISIGVGISECLCLLISGGNSFSYYAASASGFFWKMVLQEDALLRWIFLD